MAGVLTVMAANGSGVKTPAVSAIEVGASLVTTRLCS
jgi:hypothetical protein